MSNEGGGCANKKQLTIRIRRKLAEHKKVHQEQLGNGWNIKNFISGQHLRDVWQRWRRRKKAPARSKNILISFFHSKSEARWAEISCRPRLKRWPNNSQFLCIPSGFCVVQTSESHDCNKLIVSGNVKSWNAHRFVAFYRRFVLNHQNFIPFGGDNGRGSQNRSRGSNAECLPIISCLSIWLAKGHHRQVACPSKGISGTKILKTSPFSGSALKIHKSQRRNRIHQSITFGLVRLSLVFEDQFVRRICRGTRAWVVCLF